MLSAALVQAVGRLTHAGVPSEEAGSSIVRRTRVSDRNERRPRSRSRGVSKRRQDPRSVRASRRATRAAAAAASGFPKRAAVVAATNRSTSAPNATLREQTKLANGRARRRIDSVVEEEARQFVATRGRDPARVARKAAHAAAGFLREHDPADGADEPRAGKRARRGGYPCCAARQAIPHPRGQDGSRQPRCLRTPARSAGGARHSLPRCTARVRWAGDRARRATAGSGGAGVGSNGSQPYPLNQTSTHACASWSVKSQSRPVERPAGEADRDAGRDPEVAEHERHRPREVLAVTGARRGDEPDERGFDHRRVVRVREAGPMREPPLEGRDRVVRRRCSACHLPARRASGEYVQVAVPRRTRAICARSGAPEWWIVTPSPTSSIPSSASSVG